MANGAVEEIIHETTMDLLAARITMALRQRDNAIMLLREAKAQQNRAKDMREVAELELAAWSDVADTCGIRVSVDHGGVVKTYGR